MVHWCAGVKMQAAMALVMGLAGAAEASRPGPRAATRGPDVVITEPVSDLAGALTQADVAAIGQRLFDHRDKTGVQLAVVIIETLRGEPIEDFAQRTFMAWGGGTAGRDDGALFILAIKDRENRLHLGYGLEAVISDAYAGSMLANLVNALRGGDYAAATHRLLDQVFAATAHLRPDEPIVNVLGTRPSFLLFVLGLGILVGFAWLARPFPAPPTSAQAARVKKKRAKAAKSGAAPAPATGDTARALAIRRTRWLELALAIALGVLFVGWLSRHGLGYWLAVPSLYLSGVIGGLFVVAIWRKRPIGRWFFLVLLAGVGAGNAAILLYEPVVASGNVWILTAVNAFVIWMIGAGFMEDRKSSSSSHDRSRSGFWASSGSSGGSSFSGGGGSSGGGGASGRW